LFNSLLDSGIFLLEQEHDTVKARDYFLEALYFFPKLTKNADFLVKVNNTYKKRGLSIPEKDKNN